MSSTGITTSTMSGLRMPESTIVTGRCLPSSLCRRGSARPPPAGAASRQADALRRRVRDRLEPFERQHQVRAALRRGERVDLVDDDRVDVDERVARRRREHQVQALGRRDEQVRRAADEALAILRRRVAGAHRDHRRDVREPESLGGEADAEQRRAEVLLDVERERRSGEM
jgi:hypothetical protein